MEEDIFGNECEEMEVDHIYPLSKNGSNWKENKMYVCRDSNREKADKTKGSVNGINFYVKHIGRDDYGRIIGEIYIDD